MDLRRGVDVGVDEVAGAVEAAVEDVAADESAVKVLDTAWGSLDFFNLGTVVGGGYRSAVAY